MTEHPWHPAFVHFPLACWVLATMIDVAGELVSIPHIPGAHWTSVSHLLLWGGLILAVPTMIIGFFDYARLPSAVQESTELPKHIAFMIAAWTLFLTAAVWRFKAAPFVSPPSRGVTVLELMGFVSLIVGGRLASIVVFNRIPAAMHSSVVSGAQSTQAQSPDRERGERI